MRYIKPLLLMVFMITFISCGSNIAEKGKQAYQSGDYNQAIELLTTVRDHQMEGEDIDEIIVLSYMYRGQELFEKTQNIKSFSGNYNSGLKYLPQNPSANFKQEFAGLLVSLVQAYRKAIPQNKLEKEQYYTMSLKVLNQVLEFDSLNSSAHQIFAELKEENFLELLKKAQSLFNKAKQTKDWDLYFSAESYLNDAANYDPKNPEVKQLRKNLKQSTLGILNYRDGVSLAITERLYEKDKMVMFLAVKNYSERTVRLNLDQLELVDLNGTTYPIDEKEMQIRELFGQPSLKNIRLDQHEPYAEGVIAFSVPKNVAISHLILKDEQREIARKYFQ